VAYGHQTFNSWRRYLGIEPLSHLNAAYGDGDSPVPGKHGEQAMELQAVAVERVVVAHRHHRQTSLLPSVSLKQAIKGHVVCSMLPEPEFFNFLKEPKNLFQGTNSARLCSLAGRYDNPIPTRFLAPIDCLKIPELEFHDVISHRKKICHHCTEQGHMENERDKGNVVDSELFIPDPTSKGKVSDPDHIELSFSDKKFCPLYS
jgi:hypothetical protein